MSKRSAVELLIDIVKSAEKISLYITCLTYEEFIANGLVIDAVIRNIEIIGEASNRLPDEYKDKTPEIDWHKIRGLRNRIVHDYFGIDHDIIWSVINDYLPNLVIQINILLEKL